MFSVYGITGRVFHGTPGELDAVPALWPGRRIAPVGQQNNESANTFQLPLQGKVAQAKYAAQQQLEHERGPVFECRQIMHSPVITVSASASVSAAWTILQQHAIHQCPVLDERGRLVGLVSDRDLLTALVIADGVAREVLQRQVADVMRTPVLSADPSTDVRHLTALLLTQHLDGIPILGSDETLLGFVSKTDILRAVSTEPALSLWG